MEYIRGILNNFWRLTEASHSVVAMVAIVVGHGPPSLPLSLSRKREDFVPREAHKEKSESERRERERERARRKDASVVRVAFFARNLLLSRLLFGPDRNSAKCID